MLELSILGFLYNDETHGYDLKIKLSRLMSYHRKISDGSLYPAINRLKKKGYIEDVISEETTKRKSVRITEEGKTFFLNSLSNPEQVDISDRNRFYIILNFLSMLEVGDQIKILERRYSFINEPKSFFVDNNMNLKMTDIEDTFKKGMLHIAIQTTKIEKEWLQKTIIELKGE